MAQPMNMKIFYGVLVVIVLVGVGAIWMARGQGGGGVEVAPVSAAAIQAASGFGGHVMGSESAPVEIVEYADFQCPACSRFAIVTGPDVKRRIVDEGLARWRFRDFPLDQHQHAVPAHHAAACAGEQGKFWPMHDQLFFYQNEWAVDRRPYRRFEDYAEAVAVDMGQYRECMEEGRYLAQIEASKQQGIEAGVGSTPSFIIGGRMYAGVLAYDSIKVYVERSAAQ